MKKDRHYLLIFLLSIATLLLTMGVVLSDKLTYEALRDNTINRSMELQEQQVKNIVATMNQVNEDLMERHLPDADRALVYQSTLVSLARQTRMYQTGVSTLLDANYNYILDDSPDLIKRTIISDLNFQKVALHPQDYGSLSGNDTLLDCYKQMTWGQESGRCIDNWTDDPEYLYWHRIPNLGAKVNKTNYYFILSFKRDEALSLVNEHRTLRVVSITAQALFVCIAVLTAVWAVKAKKHLQTTYESRH